MTALDFFKAEMARGVDAMQSKITSVAAASPEHTAEILKMGNNLVDVDECRLGHFGSAMMEAMAEALLTMRMADWERFYEGYVLWSSLLPQCAYRGREEENARGAMLMALKSRCDSSQHQLDRLRGADHATDNDR